MKKERILVGMSGGIDSSVTACLLQKQGYEVIGVHMRFWSETELKNGQLIKKRENRCCSIESWEIAAEVCKKIGIDFKVLDLEDDFKKTIVDYYLLEQQNAQTPNPCVECNRRIKFGKFLDLMRQLEADYVATGHYVLKKELTEKGKPVYELWAANDAGKDQSYFLYTLNQEKLAHILFPLGDITKDQVRIMAKSFGLDFINKKKESQNLCFIPEKDPGPFLKRNLDPKYFRPGPVVTTEGKIIGEHIGLPLYTIGQRKGIGIGGIKGTGGAANPWYVVGYNRAANSLIVGLETDLYKKTLQLKQTSFINAPQEGEVETKIRYRSAGCPSTLTLLDKQQARLDFRVPQRAVTPGQSAVFYLGRKLVGGGIIESAF